MTEKKSSPDSRTGALGSLRSLANKGFGSAAGAAIIKAIEPFPFIGGKKLTKAKGGKVKKK